MTGLLILAAVSVVIFAVVDRFMGRRRQRDAERLIARERYRNRYGQCLSMKPNQYEIEEWRQLEALWSEQRKREKQ